MENIIYRRSARGVPHIVFNHNGRKYSICFFIGRNVLKVWDYNSPDNEKLLIKKMEPGDEYTFKQLVEEAEANRGHKRPSHGRDSMCPFGPDGCEKCAEIINMQDCTHICSGNCRREGCNCLCGEFHRVEGGE